jgi:hypothetical protein
VYLYIFTKILSLNNKGPSAIKGPLAMKKAALSRLKAFILTPSCLKHRLPAERLGPSPENSITKRVAY